MGARCNFVFKQSEDQALALYSHWGEGSMQEDLAKALEHAAVRKGDDSYYMRMAVSYLIKDDILDELGFGLYVCKPAEIKHLDHPILIDLTNSTVTHERKRMPIDDFIKYHLPSDVHLVEAT